MDSLEYYPNTNILKNYSGTFKMLEGRSTCNLCKSQNNTFYWDIYGYNNHFNTPELAIEAIKRDIPSFKQDIFN